MKDGSIELDFADGKYLFRIGISELRELQRKCHTVCPFTKVVLSSGYPLAILQRLHEHWSVDDVVEVIRQGLLGGENEIQAVNHLIETYVEKSVAKYAPTALLVLSNGLVAGFDEAEPSEEGDDEKKPQAAPPPTG